jgi:hypothetical protein
LGINIDYKQGNHYLVNVCTSRWISGSW